MHFLQLRSPATSPLEGDMDQMNRDDRLQSIYLWAAALSPDKVGPYLEGACAGDDELREQVERMLRAKDQDPGFMEHPTREAPTRLSSVSPLRGTTLGNYRLLDPLGEGAFGTVFLAEQREPVVRRVALKMLREEQTAPNVLARFEAERQALALMEHPHIATILDAGSDSNGRPYFVMEYVPGRPITSCVDEKRLTLRQRLELFEQVCHAAQHAHSKGVIHRDLKPSNIMVTTRDGRAHAKVIDFGIAKATQMRLTPHTLFTADSAFIGTPEYMSPEQVAGSPDIDTRTDVYSLGVVLYELLVGSTPFGTKALREAGFIEIVRQIREIDPPKPSTVLARLSAEASSEKKDGSAKKKLLKLADARATEPRQLARAVRGELDVIVMKALEKSPGRRYQTASELAQDVRRYLDGQPIVAAPHTAWYWVSKVARRHRPVFATAAAGVAALAIVAVVGVAGWTKAHLAGLRQQEAYAQLEMSNEKESEARRSAEIQRERAEIRELEAAEQRLRAEREAYRANIRMAEVAHQAGERRAMRDALAACDEKLRGWEWHYLHSWLDRSVKVLRDHDSALSDAVFLRGAGLVATASVDGYVRVFDADGGTVLHRLDAGLGGGVVLAGDGRRERLLIGSTDGSVRVWDARRHGIEPARLEIPAAEDEPRARVTCLAWHADSDLAAVGCADGRIVLIDTAAELGVGTTLRAFRGGVSSVSFSNDGRRLITSGRSGGGSRLRRRVRREAVHAPDSGGVPGCRRGAAAG